MFSKLQYISQGDTPAGQLRNIQTALDAGCSWIQLRAKTLEEHEVRSLAIQVRDRCKAYKATFIVNDFVLQAKEIDADGIHVGLSDMPVPEARQLLGTGKIIGGTANTLDDVRQRIAEGCDYIGLGPFRFTTTKDKLSPVLGAEGYKDIITALPASFPPVYAIGGIVPDDIPVIVATGVYGVAVSGAITNAADPTTLVHQFNQALYAGA
ncbi:thiamine phosphate synthase [Filimonas effusa]|uniref:Thiamine-phosphate synthase n=1 Tax=Filimonas effusa TaxID=2508721 RepID=A0A4Q1CZE9_9BACT|nr:thiamine phosphate synthase [Filimonas effusa]RXK80763.1 thiamine phosphate synthase [Filimonas effusa]